MNSETLGPYTLLGPLGGSDGVWLALSTDGERVVLKTFSADRTAAFRAEVTALRSVDHHGIVRIIEEGQHEETHWLALEFVAGRDLSGLRHPVAAEVRHIATGLCAALVHLHGRGLVHGDVKPANVRVGPDGDAILLDLGNAREHGRARSTGTPPYAGPGLSVVTVHDDAFAVGVVLYELITGERGDGTPPLDPGARSPADLRAVIRELTHATPTSRLSLARVTSLLGFARATSLSATLDASTSAAPDLPQIPNYAVSHEIGRGGMGVVYQARHHTTGATVAIKVCQASDQRRFVREARAARILDHPGIVRVIDADEGADGPYMIMELVPGPSLARVIEQEGAVAQRRAARWALALCEALDHAHSHGIIHRDVKPANIVMHGESPRLLDFGLASMDATVSLTQTSAVLGTPRYMAPEQVRGIDVDARADIWAVGLVLHELLVGSPAYAQEHAAAVMQAILSGPSPSPRRTDPSIATGLDRIVRKATAPHLTDRYASVRLLADDLERWIQGGTVHLPARVARAEFMHWVQRRAGVLAMVGLALVTSSLPAAWLISVGLQARHIAMVEAAAEADRQVMQAYVQRHVDAGNPTEADATLHAFLRQPAWQGTRAIARAWLAEAERVQHPASHRRALAQAYFESTHDDERSSALRSLAQEAASDWRWQELASIVQLLDPPDDDPLRRTLRGIRGDPNALDPASAALVGQATPTNWQADALVALQIDDDQSFVTTLNHRIGPIVRARDLDMPLITEPTDVGAVHLAPIMGEAGAHFLLQQDGENRVMHVVDGQLQVEHAWRGSSALGLWMGDLAGDGKRQLYAGTGPYERRLRAFEQDGERWRTLQGHAATDATGSDVLRVEAADLDKDGVQELVVLMGAWGAYDVRVYHPDGDGLTMLARRMVGQAEDMRLVPHANGTVRIAVSVRQSSPNQRIFGLSDAMGPPSGLYVFAFDQRRLEQTQFLRYHHVCDWLMDGDWDGDGLVDLAADCNGDTLVMRQDARGQFLPSVLPTATPLGSADVDQDGISELLANVGDAPDHRVWVLGAGASPLPLEVQAIQPEAGPPHPTLGTRWQRAEDLAAIGFVDEALYTLGLVAELADDDDPIGPAALRRAAALAHSHDRCAAGILGLQEAAERDPDGATEDHRAIAVCAEASMEWALAVAAREAQLALGPDQEASQHLADLTSHGLHNEVVLDFRNGTPQAAQILDPLALREADGGLAIAGDESPLLSVPMSWHGEGVQLDVELRSTRLEWAAGLEIALVPRSDPTQSYGIALHGLGGGGVVNSTLRTLWGTQVQGAIAERRTDEALDLRIVFVCDRHKRWRVTVHGLPGGVHTEASTSQRQAPPAGVYDLVVRARPEVRDQMTRADGVLHRIALRGATPIDEPSAPERVHNRALTNHRPADIPATASSLAQAIASDDLGHIDTAHMAALDDLQLRRLLRARPDHVLPVVRLSHPTRWLSLTRSAFDSALAHGTDQTVQALLLGRLSLLDGVEPDDLDSDEERSALTALRLARVRALRKVTRAEAAMTALRSLSTNAPDVQLERARVLATLGRDNDALDALSGCLAQADSPLVVAQGALVDPDLQSLSKHPRWHALLDRWLH